MKLMTVKQLMKKSKTALIRKITKSLRSMPKKKLAMLCYEISKSKLPRLRTRSDPIFGDLKIPKSKRTMPISLREQIEYRKPRTKRKFSKKQLAAQRLFAKRARAGTLRRR